MAEMLRTKRGVEYRVTKTAEEFAESLGAITVSTDAGGPFRMCDWLTPDEAVKLAAQLMTVAGEVEPMSEDDSRRLSEDIPF
jgi:hypothetical protein